MPQCATLATMRINKIIILNILLLVSLHISAQVNIVDTREETCDDISKGRVFRLSNLYTIGTPRGPYEIDIKKHNTQMVSELSELVDILLLNKDKKLKRSFPVCVGIIEDYAGANAFANGYDLIAIGERLVEKFENELQADFEDLFSVVLLHEYSHTIQNLYRQKYKAKLNSNRDKLKELQADCMSAVYLKLLGRDTNSVQQAQKEFTKALGDKSFTGDHGTAYQRMAPINHGKLKFEQYRSDYSKINSQFIFKNICSTRDLSQLLH